jgi:hypothetical protein
MDLLALSVIGLLGLFTAGSGVFGLMMLRRRCRGPRRCQPVRSVERLQLGSLVPSAQFPAPRGQCTIANGRDRSERAAWPVIGARFAAQVRGLRRELLRRMR